MKYPGDISPEAYAAMEEGYEQGRAAAEAEANRVKGVDPTMFWDVLRERDDYQARCAAVVPRIEGAASWVSDHTGTVTGLILPIEDWRSLRSMLQREHRPASTST
jgi:hypothetical protein